MTSEREVLLARLLGDGVEVGELDGDSGLLCTREVAMLFQVSERAVTDWAATGKIRSLRTPGGHRRYPATHVRTLLEAAGQA